MKTGDQTSKKGISFGFSAVNAGQRNASVEPQFIATSTDGGFRITSAVSKILGIAAGENIMFVSNVDNLDKAILEKDEALVEFCTDNGLELGTPEALIAIHSEFDQWGIAKGIQLFDTKGNAQTGVQRLTKKDKAKYVATNFDLMLETLLSEENGATQEVKDALTREGITVEEQADILAGFVQADEVTKFSGSKTANPGGKTGIGTVLTFTDSNVWKQIKVDMGDKADKLNRIFDLDVENIVDVEMSNGHKTVTIKVLPLGDSVDKEPARNGAGEEEVPEA